MPAIQVTADEFQKIDRQVEFLINTSIADAVQPLQLEVTYTVNGGASFSDAVQPKQIEIIQMPSPNISNIKQPVPVSYPSVGQAFPNKRR